MTSNFDFLCVKNGEDVEQLWEQANQKISLSE